METIILILLGLFTIICGIFEIINDIKKGEYWRMSIIAIFLGAIIFISIFRESPFVNDIYYILSFIKRLILPLIYACMGSAVIIGILYFIVSYIDYKNYTKTSDEYPKHREKLVLKIAFILFGILVLIFTTLLYGNINY